MVEGFTFRKDSILECGEISWRCTSNKQKCKAKVLSGDLTHNHEVNARKIERKILRVSVKKNLQISTQFIHF